MAEKTKKTAPTKKKSAPKPPAVPSAPSNKTVEGIFAKIQKKTGLSDEKLDKFQKEWLTVPEQRKKYENLKDAPLVVGEELVAITNDIIDFLQKQDAGKSHVFGKMKAIKKEIATDPKGFFKTKAIQSKAAAIKAKEVAMKAKETVSKMTAGAKASLQTPQTTEVKSTAKPTEKTVKSNKKSAKK